jgi:hypothetical protein
LEGAACVLQLQRADLDQPVQRAVDRRPFAVGKAPHQISDRDALDGGDD